MIDFDEELKKFQPGREVESAAEAVYEHELSDVSDLLREMFEEITGRGQENKR